MGNIDEKRLMELEEKVSNLQKRMTVIEDICYAAKEVLTLEEASKFLGMAKSTLYKLTHLNTIPFYKPCGKLIFFEKGNLLSWVRGAKTKSEEEIRQEAALKLQVMNERP